MKQPLYYELEQYLRDLTGPNQKSFVDVKCLVITSLDDTKIKSLFKNCEYNTSTIDEFADSDKKIYDTILCLECLHEREDWDRILVKMYQSLLQDGFMSISCAGLGRPGVKPIGIHQVNEVFKFEREFTWLNINYHPTRFDLRFEGYKA